MFSTLLSCARRGLSLRLYGGGRVLFTLKNGEYRFPKGCEGYLSVFAFGKDATGVTLSGVKYPLQEATLYLEKPLGVSNEFLADEAATVRVDDGILLLICEQF
jgi:thiamine pyrophosphokinase